MNVLTFLQTTTYITTVGLVILHADSLKTGSDGTGGLVAGEKTETGADHGGGGGLEFIRVFFQGHVHGGSIFDTSCQWSAGEGAHRGCDGEQKGCDDTELHVDIYSA